VISDRDYVIIGKYLAGECSRLERAAVESRVAEDSDFAVMFDALQEIWGTQEPRSDSSGPAGLSGSTGRGGETEGRGRETDSAEKTEGTGKSGRPGQWDIDAFWDRMSRRIDQELDQSPRTGQETTDTVKETTDSIQEITDTVQETTGTVQKKIHTVQPKKRTTKRVGRGAIWAFRIAALLVISAMVGLVTMSWLAEPELDTAAMNEVGTERGQRAEVQLEDGTTIRLNSDSRITYPASFSNDIRSVSLTGEAYFDIARDERPFKVYAEGAEIEILGTEFNVTAYRDEEGLQIVVAEGVIDVSYADGNEISRDIAQLGRGEMVEIQRSTGSFSLTHDVDLAYHLGWLEYRLEFEDKPAGEVARTLERWYGIDITFSEPELADLRLTASFNDDSVQEVLRVMELSLGLGTETEGRAVIFFRKES